MDDEDERTVATRIAQGRGTAVDHFAMRAIERRRAAQQHEQERQHRETEQIEQLMQSARDAADEEEAEAWSTIADHIETEENLRAEIEAVKRDVVKLIDQVTLLRETFIKYGRAMESEVGELRGALFGGPELLRNKSSAVSSATKLFGPDGKQLLRRNGNAHS